ncbi:MAG: hypothetical protein CMJ58_26755 [Planctomycetaceae bacterium]|nr:hypothetical protein [Planctomycetaceae bacterium]
MLQLDRQLDRRILVVGNSAAGKTTLARDLAARWGYSHVELDSLYWGPNWQPAAEDEFRTRVAAAVAGDSWIVDGNYFTVRELTWPRATALVWLNYSLPVVLRRGIARSVRRVLSRQELFGGNRESWRQMLSGDDIPAWIVRMHWRRRAEIRSLLKRPECQHLRLFECASPADAQRLLRA